MADQAVAADHYQEHLILELPEVKVYIQVQLT
jgi:hypothetical protein